MSLLKAIILANNTAKAGYREYGKRKDEEEAKAEAEAEAIRTQQVYPDVGDGELPGLLPVPQQMPHTIPGNVQTENMTFEELMELQRQHHMRMGQ